MRETYDIRLFVEYLPQISDDPSAAARSDLVSAKVCGTVGDGQFSRIAELSRRLRQSGQGSAFGGWEIKRTYNKNELAQAQLFLLDVTFRHLSAEEYGTRYEEYEQCQHEVDTLEHVGGHEFRIARRKIPCSIRAKQIGALRFPHRQLGTTRDIFRLWGGELVVSKRFMDLVSRHKFTGARFVATCDTARPARTASRRKREFGQLKIKSRPLRVGEAMRFGATPFDIERSGYQQCEAGTIAGDRPISVVSVIGSSWDGSDFCRTEVYVGGRGGLFRPYQLLIVSKRMFEALQRHGLKGFRYEIVDVSREAV